MVYFLVQTRKEKERKRCMRLLIRYPLLMIDARYQTAARLSERLDEMGKDLSSMIEEINDASSALGNKNKTDDPVSWCISSLIVGANQ